MAVRGACGGIVYLVGAGPGDPRLITVAGLDAIRSSDVIVYDRLVNRALLEEAPARAERIPVGKRPGGHAVAQALIDAILIDKARTGLTVTRLKGGDPFVFGRGGEECEALEAAGVPYAVIPGVTSAVAVPGLAGIPVTHRRYSSAFAVVTGHQCQDPSVVDWDALARIPTLIVLMGLATLARTARRLMAAGVPRSRPAAVVASGTLPHERAVTGTLETIARQARDAAIEAPAVLIVGEVVRLRETLRSLRRTREVRFTNDRMEPVPAGARAGTSRVAIL
jgi:uroporphyrin-III C-methyltransferase